MGRAQRSIKRRCILIAVFIFVTVVYLGVSAIIMRTMERPVEDRNFDDMNAQMQTLNINQSEMDRLEELGICTFPNHRYRHWTITGACFFSLTVITTIGYGSYAPITQKGRTFTVFFAIFGIGVVGNMLAQCASLLSTIFREASERIKGGRDTRTDPFAPGASAASAARWDAAYERFVPNGSGELACADLAEFLTELTGCKEPDQTVLAYIVQEVDQASDGFIPLPQIPRAVQLWYEVQMELPRGVTWRLIVMSVGGAGCWVILWAGLFALIENWTFREGMWFCFVTMSTIGFGDFVPETHLGRMMAFVFIIPGLGLGAGALGTLWDAFVQWRFWWLQRMYRRNKVSSKMLEAHGIGISILPTGPKTLPWQLSKAGATQLRRGGRNRAPGEGLLVLGAGGSDQPWQRDSKGNPEHAARELRPEGSSGSRSPFTFANSSRAQRSSKRVMHFEISRGGEHRAHSAPRRIRLADRLSESLHSGNYDWNRDEPSSPQTPLVPNSPDALGDVALTGTPSTAHDRSIRSARVRPPPSRLDHGLPGLGGGDRSYSDTQLGTGTFSIDGVSSPLPLSVSAASTRSPRARGQGGTVRLSSSPRKRTFTAAGRGLRAEGANRLGGSLPIEAAAEWTRST